MVIGLACNQCPLNILLPPSQTTIPRMRKETLIDIPTPIHLHPPPTSLTLNRTSRRTIPRLSHLHQRPTILPSMPLRRWQLLLQYRKIQVFPLSLATFPQTFVALIILPDIYVSPIHVPSEHGSVWRGEEDYVVRDVLDSRRFCW